MMLLTKAELRKTYLLKRNQLGLDAIHGHSAVIQHAFWQYITTQHISLTSVHTYIAMPQRSEFDPLPMIQQLWQQGVHVYTSISHIPTSTMQHVPYTAQTLLAPDKYGIPTPQDMPLSTDIQYDIIFIPLLAFDTHGFRVGYGKGMYDRFLATQSGIKAGFSFFPPIDEITDTDPFDIPLNVCFTPQGTYKFTP